MPIVSNQGSGIGFALESGDLEPNMVIALLNPGAQAQLAASTAVNLLWQKPDGTQVTVPLTVANSTGVAGTFPAYSVQRAWASGDTAQVGTHRGRVKITCSNAEIVSEPSDGSWLIWTVNP